MRWQAVTCPQRPNPKLGNSFRGLVSAHLTGLSVRDTDETVGDFIATKVSKPRKLEGGAEFGEHVEDRGSNRADDRQAIADAQAAQDGGDTNGVASTAAIGRFIRDGMKEVTYLSTRWVNTGQNQLQKECSTA